MKRLVVLLSVAACGLAGCVTVPPEAPTAQMAASRSAVEQARQAGADTADAADYNMAHDKLLRAESSYQAGDYVLALRLAREAEVDAQLAQAKANSAKSQVALNELEASSRALRDEINRAPLTR